MIVERESTVSLTHHYVERKFSAEQGLQGGRLQFLFFRNVAWECTRSFARKKAMLAQSRLAIS